MQIQLSRFAVSALTALFATIAMPASLAADVRLGVSNQLFIVDHSGSMGGKYGWIAEAANALQRNQGVAGSFGLMEFSKNTRAVALNDGLFGSARQFGQAVTALKQGGGMEDGYLAIDEAIRQYSLATRSAPHIVLITDEHRSAVKRDVNVGTVSAMLAEAQIPVSVVVNVRFMCAGDQLAFGMNSHGKGIVFDDREEVSECEIVDLVTPTREGNSVTDYVDLALSTGGSAWDMLIPRSGAQGTVEFAKAFSQVHGAAIDRSMQQLDVVPAVSYFPDQPNVGDVVTFNASNSNGVSQSVSWQWDLNADRQPDVNGESVAHVFQTPGWHEVRLSASTQESGVSAKYSFKIKVGK